MVNLILRTVLQVPRGKTGRENYFFSVGINLDSAAVQIFFRLSFAGVLLSAVGENVLHKVLIKRIIMEAPSMVL
jgi:hypothetical protein